MVDAARCFDMIRLCHRSDPFFGPADYVDLATATKDEYTRREFRVPSGSVTPEYRKEFAKLRNSELKTAGALALKETAMARYNYVYERPARKYFR